MKDLSVVYCPRRKPKEKDELWRVLVFSRAKLRRSEDEPEGLLLPYMPLLFK